MDICEKVLTRLEIDKILEEALNEILKPVDEEQTLADYMEKSFNQGAKIMCMKAQLKIAQAIDKLADESEG